MPVPLRGHSATSPHGSFSVQIDTQAADYFDNFTLSSARGWGRVLSRVGDVYLEELRAATPVGVNNGDPDRTPGALRAGWRKILRHMGDIVVVDVYNDAPHFRYVREGRGAIDQTRKSGAERHPLRFWYRGELLFRWRVGPVAPSNFVETGLARAEVRANNALGSIIEDVLYGDR